jgi:hypothetical protein
VRLLVLLLLLLLPPPLLLLLLSSPLPLSPLRSAHTYTRTHARTQ